MKSQIRVTASPLGERETRLSESENRFCDMARLCLFLLFVSACACQGAAQVLCPDQHTQCPSRPEKNTCCPGLTAASYVCCPAENATCCGDGVHCCPHGYDCESASCKKANEEDSMPMRASPKKSSEVDYLERTGQETLAEKKEDEVVCPDGSKCASGQTCCPTTTGEYSCCPLPYAVCCPDKVHCCPNDYACEDTRCVDQRRHSLNFFFAKRNRHASGEAQFGKFKN